MNLAPFIDHTNLSPTATSKDIDQLCKEALEYNFASVCVHSVWAQHIIAQLKGSVASCVVVDFPFGAAPTSHRTKVAADLSESGVQELDIVVPLGLVLSGNWLEVERDLKEIRENTLQSCLKLILETCYLSDDDKRFLAKMASGMGYDFVKTSTGFGPSGATEADVTILKNSVYPWTEVKASGGIKSTWKAHCMIKAGASRIGTSRGIDLIMDEGTHA
jgi:deoxyribose-phosphate aldolase